MNQRHAWMGRDPGEIAITALQRTDERRVDLDSGDAGVTRSDRTENVPASADADDSDLAPPKPVR